MLIGVPKEVKIEEHRVGLLPGSVRELVHHGRLGAVRGVFAGLANATTLMLPFADARAASFHLTH